MSNANLQEKRLIWQKIDLYLEEFYPQSKQAGQDLKSADLEMAQIRGLENLVVCARRFSEIYNYIKNQAGKENKVALKWRQVAQRLLDQLEVMENKGIELGGEDPAMILETKLRLARGWIKQVVSQYMFLKVAPEL